VRDDRLLVEGLHAEAEVVEVATFPARRGAAALAERTVDGDQVDHRAAEAQVRHAELRPPRHVLRAERFAVETTHRVDVAHAQHQVIDFADPDHRRVTSRESAAI